MPARQSPPRAFSVATEVYLFPHSDREGFFTPADLKEFLDGRLMKRSGKYRVVAANRYQGPQRGDLVLFHKDRHFVGRARVGRALRMYAKPYVRNDIPYRGEVIFHPKSIKTYRKPVPFEKIESSLKATFTFRGPCKVNWAVYDAINAAK